MTEKLDQARDATKLDYERLLRQRSGNAVDGALDLHYDRVDPLVDDIDGELDAMKAILLAHKPGSGPAANLSAKPVRSNAPPFAMESGGKRRPSVDETVLTSPFRFVALNDAVVPPERDRPDLGRPLAGGYRAVIRVDWAAETPLLIGAGGKEDDVVVPMTIGAGKTPVIPGATIRGCLRAALEIVASGRLGQINAHAIYGLRDFDHPLVKSRDESQSLLAAKNVRAGWLTLGPEGVTITPCADWYLIPIAALRPASRDPYQFRANWLRKTIPERYADIERSWVSGSGETDRTIRFSAMKPRRFAIEEQRGDGKTILGLDSDGAVSGHLVFSNRSPAAASAQDIETKERNGGPGQPKKYEYVFDSREGTPFTVPPEAWQRFRAINSKIFKNKMKGDGSWGILERSLVDPGDRIPVFYVGAGADLQIGLTRFFKIRHRYSLGQIRDRDPAHRRAKAKRPEEVRLDFVEALFGYVHEADELFDPVPDSVGPGALARRGRVACGFARLTGAARVGPVVATVMGAPRASFAPFYLRGRYKDYSSPEPATRLAGRKRYPPRFPAETAAGAETAINGLLREQIARIERDSGNRPSSKVQSRLSFLLPAAGERELRFSGDLRLDNVSAAELGAVLWVLTHGGDPAKPYRHMIGRGKPFGAGQMRVDRLSIRLIPNDADARRLMAPPEAWERAWGDGDHSMAPFLRAFHGHMRRHRPHWPRTADLGEFLAASDPSLWDHRERSASLEYPRLKSFNEIRKIGKLSTGFVPPNPRPDRHLPVLPDTDAALRYAEAAVLPYSPAESKR
ncbi:TIGR03986 family type III CRISPR-associated RAMP protein [Azospirillum agricola]|uniref:TIGR03986 family type III CRISPR-associated RAMP protein n=1 Tax=Azospirillum agricola TaxID=1720247 RepID=UPI000A0EF2A5|nr:TIGR03986 family CRISPR-associated RAMP protein [Azospirillum agricola]SMH30325.1 CRISPR-associated protein [Azospirillum lipoferum]